MSNLDVYKKDLEELILKGKKLQNALLYEIVPKVDFLQALKLKNKKEEDKFISSLPDFKSEYQEWYSEAKTIIKLMLPDRLDDFVEYYEVPAKRRSMQDIDSTNYVIADALSNITLSKTTNGAVVAGKSSAFPKFQQQLAILKSVRKRFESSLFNIQQFVRADLFDSELDAAKYLNENGFSRAAGALAGVVLESHLNQVCQNHLLTLKKNPTISNYNDILYSNKIIDIQIFRKIQHLADIRNNCDHKKITEPTAEDAEDMINGVTKIIKNLF